MEKIWKKNLKIFNKISSDLIPRFDFFFAFSWTGGGGGGVSLAVFFSRFLLGLVTFGCFGGSGGTTGWIDSSIGGP